MKANDKKGYTIVTFGTRPISLINRISIAKNIRVISLVSSEEKDKIALQNPEAEQFLINGFPEEEYPMNETVFLIGSLGKNSTENLANFFKRMKGKGNELVSFLFQPYEFESKEVHRYAEEEKESFIMNSANVFIIKRGFITSNFPLSLVQEDLAIINAIEATLSNPDDKEIIMKNRQDDFFEIIK